MMKIIDLKLINRFRAWINDNNYTLFAYSKKNGMNQWGCICSAMDWITVAVEYVEEHPLEGIRQHGSIELYAYISCIDIILESIEQLHRVVFSTDEVVFVKDCECFADNPFQQTDREYFKTIRSCFGAHPINLKEPGKGCDKTHRRFASWSGGHFGTYNYTVALYSNQIGKKDIFLSIQFSQLLDFESKYYNYLTVVQEELSRQYKDFLEKMQRTPIMYKEKELPHLYNLLEESHRRLNNDYYEGMIEELIAIYATPIVEEENQGLVKAYQKALRPLINEIHRNLQNMTFADLKYGSRLSPKPRSMPDGWGYWMGKLHSNALGNDNTWPVWEGQIKELFSGMFVQKYDSVQELWVLANASLYSLMRKEQAKKR